MLGCICMQWCEGRLLPPVCPFLVEGKMEQVLHKLVRQTWCASSVKFFTDIKVIINVIKKKSSCYFFFFIAVHFFNSYSSRRYYLYKPITKKTCKGRRLLAKSQKEYSSLCLKADTVYLDTSGQSGNSHLLPRLNAPIYSACCTNTTL